MLSSIFRYHTVTHFERGVKPERKPSIKMLGIRKQKVFASGFMSYRGRRANRFVGAKVVFIV